ncbi:hypothetical protein KY346_02290 [Candidatus Woesearchaeota archaeon]|nr:hypothetical protein [Candidatus Woesearchaeota archaeon]
MAEDISDKVAKREEILVKGGTHFICRVPSDPETAKALIEHAKAQAKGTKDKEFVLYGATPKYLREE